MRHYLAPLLKPQSVALVGASDQAATLGRTVFENLLAGGFQGELYAVNPNRRRLFGHRVYATLAAIGKPIDLAIIAAPSAAVPDILADVDARVRAAVLMSVPVAGEPAVNKAWRREVATIARKRGVRLVGPAAFGVIRTDVGLNGTYCAPAALPGRLALVSQSGAVCTALLDFALPMQMGFSTVISLGGGIDIGFGELLDALVTDPATDAILLYVEGVGDARAFLSALRAAARTKPVVVLKAGRSLEHVDGNDRLALLPDQVFDAALTRAGAVRVGNYTQLLAAARILASGKIPRGNRLAIVANGRGPGLLASDRAAANGVALAQFSPTTVRALDAVLPVEIERGNPVDVRGDAPPERLAVAVATVLSDANVDAVLALHVPRPIIGAMEAARAVAEVARGSGKPVLGAWLGAVNRPDVHVALETGGIANFFTPENAVDAFSFLAAYRRNQAWLLEVPPSQPDPEPLDFATADRVRDRALTGGRQTLPTADAGLLLAAFGITLAPFAVADTLQEVQAAARRIGYPIALLLEGTHPRMIRTSIANGRALVRAYGELLDAGPARKSGEWNGRVVVQRHALPRATGSCAIALATDAVFGPVIVVRATAHVTAPVRAPAMMLPPLNRRLATDLLIASGIATPAPMLVQLLLQVSGIACALPWVREIEFDPIAIAHDRVEIVGARVVVDPKRKQAPGYRHMAIHPYPVELESEIVLDDGTRLTLRPIRPEDAELERLFVASLSEQTRYFRFFYRLHELTPAMIARFTQVDYDRELALLALDPAPGAESIVGLARYVTNPDQESAEFAVVVTDAWHGRGIARRLMTALIAAAKKKGLQRLVGTVLRANHGMLYFSAKMGFTVRDNPDDPEQVIVELPLH